MDQDYFESMFPTFGGEGLNRVWFMRFPRKTDLFSLLFK